jgi:sec-independent protein translocase protein TatA
MFNVGIPELVIIVGLALLIVGPQRLPEIAKSLGKGMRAFRFFRCK